MMKINGNDKINGNYYVGVDAGTNSVGWAVTDHDYNLLKFKGKHMWGVRLFDEATDASTRRINRGNRRRLERKNGPTRRGNRAEFRKRCVREGQVIRNVRQ